MQDNIQQSINTNEFIFCYNNLQSSAIRIMKQLSAVACHYNRTTKIEGFMSLRKTTISLQIIMFYILNYFSWIIACRFSIASKFAKIVAIKIRMYYLLWQKITFGCIYCTRYCTCWNGIINIEIAMTVEVISSQKKFHGDRLKV